MRRLPPADGPRSTRKSRTFYPTNQALQERMRATSPEGFYIFMLYEDLDHVVPYTIGLQGGQGARVTGPDADNAWPLIERALSGQEWTRSLSDTVRKFVSSTAQNVFQARRPFAQPASAFASLTINQPRCSGRSGASVPSSASTPLPSALWACCLA